jgi:hypothetical protein
MKKRDLTYAGIVSAAILVIMFAGILMTGSFSIFSTVNINPIPDHAAGDLVAISGTTNLLAGTRLELDIVTASPDPPGRTRVGSTDAFIVHGGGMSNTWSGALDTSAIPPGEYLVSAYGMNETFGRGALLATARLKLTNTTPDPDRITPMSANHKVDFITIDRPGTIHRGEKILISGKTNLPVDTELIYAVIQQSNTSVFTVDPKTGKQELREGLTRTGLISLLPGDNGVSRWSFAVDSTEFIPDRYEVIVTPASTRTEDIGKTGTFGRESLVVLESGSDLITPPAPVAGPCQSIRIDTFPDKVGNRTYTITGTTSLQPGTELLFQVLPSQIEVSMNMGDEGMTASGAGAMGTMEVIGGIGGVNTWSADLNLAELPSDEYIMNISNDRIDPRTYATVYGDTYCSKRFIRQV